MVSLDADVSAIGDSIAVVCLFSFSYPDVYSYDKALFSFSFYIEL